MGEEHKTSRALQRRWLSGLWATLWPILFVLAIPFALLFMLGDLVAKPLEKHRHKNVPVWLLWNFLRMSVVWIIGGALIVLLVILKHLQH